ncbi:MAG TPA: efflux RND transporter periplasmic adaptor subunit [Spirochaetota bacterium]|nr:efflux RND transporter periplasmic adaptor subunit [Spirochaetota bacterium]HPJ33900.1 efflux RND transporter periplasmic adaptor subunit [Spirochaetota bacterium]
MKNKKIIPVAVVVAVVAAATLYFEIFRHIESNGTVISGSGTIEVTEIDISSKISGRVAEIPRGEGAEVKKGELLVKLQYDELSAQRVSAVANFRNAEKNYKRISRLYRTGSVSRRDLDNAEAAYKVAKAAMDNVDAAIDYAVIYSPIDGIVLDTILEPGEMAFPGTPVLTVADISKPWMYLYVNEKKLGYVKIGQKVNVMIDSFPDRVFKGAVVSISNKAEFTPKTIQTKEERVKLVFAVKVAIENNDMILKPGMPADADILLEGEPE